MGSSNAARNLNNCNLNVIRKLHYCKSIKQKYYLECQTISLPILMRKYDLSYVHSYDYII
jgi:hypothetical protein